MGRLLGVVIAAVGALAAASPLAVAQNMLTIDAPPDYYIVGGRVIDNNSPNKLEPSMYYVGSGHSVSVALRPPFANGYSLILQFLVASTTFPGDFSVSNEGACSRNTTAVNKQIKLSLSCDSSQPFCGCSVAIGQQAAPPAPPPAPTCPFTCQSWNPASNSCVGAAMNGC